MRPLVVSVCALALLACQFDTTGVAPDDGAVVDQPDSTNIDSGSNVDGNVSDASLTDASLADAAPPDASLADAAPPADADPCDLCDDNIACTNDVCMNGICTPTDNCIVGACNATTEQCDATLVLREGLDGYASTRDTFIRESEPLVNSGSLTVLEWDADDPMGDGTMNAGLIRFDGVFGSASTQVPANATISSATLRLTVMDQSVGPEPATVHEVRVAWDEGTVTWSNFGGEPGIQNDERSAAVANAAATSCPCPATLNIDVTTSLQKWLANPAENLGWLFIPGANDGMELASKEHSPAVRRPQLTIVYSVPAVTTMP